MEIKIGGKTFLIIIILIVIGIVAWAVSGYFVKDESDESDLSDLDKFAKCLSERSTLFVRTGCPACTKQKELFGSSIDYLNMVDCKSEPDKCTENDIAKIPTWIINGVPYVGVQSFERLGELTGCSLS